MRVILDQEEDKKERKILAFVFDDDAERLRIIKVLSDMQPKEGKRMLVYHHGVDYADIEKYMDDIEAGKNAPMGYARSQNTFTIHADAD